MIPDTTGIPDITSQRFDAINGFKSVGWDDLARVGAFITSDDVTTLRDIELYGIEGVGNDDKIVVQTVSALLKVLKNVTTNEDAINYAVTRVDDLLSVNLRSRVDVFVSASEDPAGQAAIDPSPFMRLVINGTPYQQKTASRILSRLYSVKGEGCETYMNWILEQLREASSDASAAKLGVSALVVLLNSHTARERFHAMGGLPLLASALLDSSPRAAAANAQFQYEGCFALWTLTLCPAALKDMLATGGLDVLCQQVSKARREKVIRVCMMALKNVVCTGGDSTDAAAAAEAGKDGDDVIGALLARGLRTSLQHLVGRQWTDGDIQPDVEAVLSELVRTNRSLTTFDRYEAEVAAGRLAWGPLHEEPFFQEHAKKMEAEDFRVVRRLLSLLSSEHATTVAVACNDIGEFCRFYPNGKSIVGHLEGKPVIMGLMTHHEPEVQRRALACISKLMLRAGHADAVNTKASKKK